MSVGENNRLSDFNIISSEYANLTCRISMGGPKVLYNPTTPRALENPALQGSKMYG
jgi:hypothetical protein